MSEKDSTNTETQFSSQVTYFAAKIRASLERIEALEKDKEDAENELKTTLIDWHRHNERNRVHESEKMQYVHEWVSEPTIEPWVSAGSTYNDGKGQLEGEEGRGSIGSGDLSSNIQELGKDFLNMLYGSGKGKQAAMEYDQSGNLETGVRDNIERLEEKLRALVDASEKQFKKCQCGPCKSFIYCQKECHESDGEWEALKAMKTRVIAQGIKLSWLLVDLLYFLSGTEGGVDKIQVLISSLKWVLEGDHSVAIGSIIDLLEMADQEVRKMKSGKKVESLASDEESHVDQLVLESFGEILGLEHILSHPRLPDLSVLEASLKQSEEELDGMQTRMNEFKAKSAFVSPDDVHEFEYRKLEAKINETWNHVGGSEAKDRETDQ